MDGFHSENGHRNDSSKDITSWREKLAHVIGADRVLDNIGDLKDKFPLPADTANLVLMQPCSNTEVQEMVRLAAELNMPLITCNDRYQQPPAAGRKAIFLDFSHMAAIEKIDRRNLVAHIQRGVTFKDLIPELDAQDLKLAPPLVAGSDSILCNYVNRVPLKKATLFPDPHVYNMQVVLADGRLMKTGSHALNEEADLKEDGGPSLSRWFLGSEDMYGIITRATIGLYPKAECRDALVFAFDRLEDIVQALRNGPRTEQGWEYLAVNHRFFISLTGEEHEPPAPWCLISGFDGLTTLVNYQKRQVLKIIGELGGRPIEGFNRTFSALLDLPWYPASCSHTGFYSPCNRIRHFDDIIQKHISAAEWSSKDIGQCLLAVDRGRCLFSYYDFPDDLRDTHEVLTAIDKVLVQEGAFFNRPRTDAAGEMLNQAPNLKKQLRTIKSIMDPQGIINSGRYVNQSDTGYTPLSVEILTEEDTGIKKDNIRVVEERLKEAVGEDWVSANPVDLAAYGRDFTIFSGERPNLVVLPESTEEVQKVMQIAYRHKIPVVPLTTGFNHGGLAIPRKGGILIDLKRMNRLIEIDEETMTATFEPGVRMRTLWYECQKVTTYMGIKLKPILPLTLASISLLSNYVSRGGPGSAVKYGFDSDLTVNMTWVMPNGEVLKLGPSSLAGTGNLGIQGGPGPDISGMFFNADGAFGICTQITVKLYPDLPCEQLIQTAIFDEDPVGCEKACQIIYDLTQKNLLEFIYKSHPGVMCTALSGFMETDPLDLVNMVPKHPVLMIITGLDEEEIQIRLGLVREILSRNEVIEMDLNMFGPEFAELATTIPLKSSVGVKNNTVGAYRGAFQWQAGYIKIEKIPEINQEYKKLIKKYWKTSDVNITLETSLTGTDIQGPLPYARLGTVEFDYWWDQGNPESVKRASIMIRKTTELMFRFGALPIRNMFGFGELLLPQLAVYTDILKQLRNSIDPANLMHPDVLPVTDDYV